MSDYDQFNKFIGDIQSNINEKVKLAYKEGYMDAHPMGEAADDINQSWLESNTKRDIDE